MQTIPIQYIEPVFRPPSEARSLILPVTNGCSWNKCTYCEMYTAPQKAFAVRDLSQVLGEIRATAARLPQVTRVFLGDGDALMADMAYLRSVLQALNEHFPYLERVSSYCLPRNLRKKSVQELSELKQLKLDLLYVGAESGSDQVLKKVLKGETYQTTLDALIKIREAGLRSSVMILNGLGGTRFSREHAIESARLANAAQPDYLATLVVSFPMGEERFRERFPEYHPLNQRQLFEEIRLFLDHLELRNTAFRSDHASNYLVLKGTLGADKARLLAQVNQAIEAPDSVFLREEWQRGL